MRYDLRKIQTKQNLIDFIGIQEPFFDAVLNFDATSNYQEIDSLSTCTKEIRFQPFFKHSIPKKNKDRGHRIVWEPVLFRYNYKALSRRLSNFFENFLPGYPHPAAYGYLGGRNIKQNAAAHSGHRFLLSTDIVDFFPSITCERIKQLFIELQFSEEISNYLSKFMTINGTLPLGLPTSPVLSNAIFLPVDVDLQIIAENSDSTYTRYSDDISFSSNSELPSFDSIAKIIHSYKFKIAESKTKISKSGQAHFVTGLSITDPRGPHVPRAKKRRLRQEIYYANKFGIKSHFEKLNVKDLREQQRNINRLDGLVKFVAFHETRHTHDLKSQWEKILVASGVRPSYEPVNQNSIPFCICIDEAEFRNEKDIFLAIALSVSQHQDQLYQAASRVLDNWKSDLWAAGSQSIIEKRGLHFADASEDLRLNFVIAMQNLPFEGYVSFGRLMSSDDYEKKYLILIKSIIRRRLMAAESQHAHFIIEKNSKVSPKNIESLIFDAFNELIKHNNRRPKNVTIQFVQKPDLLISFPDFLLGVLGKFLRSPKQKSNMPIPRDELMFERIRDKYRLIADVDNGVEFSRRRLIQPWSS